MQLEDVEADAIESELAAERTATSTVVKCFERNRPARKPFPEHLPRERVVIAAPQSCPCCGSTKLSKLGGDVTETLEVVPRQWKVIQTVRERFSCRQCEAIMQPPAPFHVTPRGFAGPRLHAMILFEKFGQHQPLNRQSERYAREGVELSLSTLADQVGACAAALRPLHALIEAHVLAAERLHGARTLMERPNRYGPRFAVDKRHNEILWEIWVAGFEKAVKLRPSACQKLLTADHETAQAMSGLLTLADVDRHDSRITPEQLDALTAAAPHQIGPWVVTLNEWRLANYAPTRMRGGQI